MDYSMKTNFELVKEFHAAFNKEPDPTTPTQLPLEKESLRLKLIQEEKNELFAEFYKAPPNGVDLANMAKELADLLYVVYGTAAAYGIPIDDVYREVHKSNMSKLGEDGKPIYREDGKVLKGPNYKAPDIESIIKGK